LLALFFKLTLGYGFVVVREKQNYQKHEMKREEKERNEK